MEYLKIVLTCVFILGALFLASEGNFAAHAFFISPLLIFAVVLMAFKTKGSIFNLFWKFCIIFFTTFLAFSYFLETKPTYDQFGSYVGRSRWDTSWMGVEIVFFIIPMLLLALLLIVVVKRRKKKEDNRAK
jgi:hypothetical protein